MTMAKKIAVRGVVGFVIGVFLGKITQLIISLMLGKGEYLPVSDQFGDMFETEMAAVLSQFFLTGLIGVVLALGSFIFEIDKWGLLKQHLLHFVITGAVWVPVVLICWMPQSRNGVLILLGNFIGAYIITYWIQFATSKKDIQRINSVLKYRKTGGV
jgi:predicted lysophospholipase L1 biosynthesis ABC-type transport system permease subunit